MAALAAKSGQQRSWFLVGLGELISVSQGKVLLVSKEEESGGGVRSQEEESGGGVRRRRSQEEEGVGANRS